MKTLWIFIILNVFSLCAFAQSKHTSVWNIDDKILIFEDNSVRIENNNNYKDKEILYVDSKGKIKLIVDLVTNLLLNSQFEPVRGIEKINEPIRFVVPSPNNCNQVYAFGWGQYILVDINNNETIGDVMSLKELCEEDDYVLFDYILVHHSNCKDIWLIYYNSYVMYKYLITSSGIEYKDTKRINWQYNNPRRNDYVVINLSNDCKHYTANLLGDSIVCYGDFDRTTGEFVRKIEKKVQTRPEFAETQITNSLISKDNKSIYYFCAPFTKEYQHFREILSVDIVEGKPDYENIHIIYSTIVGRGAYAGNDMFYGSDGNIYIRDFDLGKMYRIIPSFTGKPFIDDNFLTFELDVEGTMSDNFLADWFSQNPCGENCGCPEMKKPVIICE